MTVHCLFKRVKELRGRLNATNSSNEDDSIMDVDIATMTELSLTDALRQKLTSLIAETKEQDVSAKSVWDLACAFWEKHNELQANSKDEVPTTLAEVSDMTCSLLSNIPESALTTENKLCILNIQIKNIKNWITAKKIKKAESFLESIWDKKDSLMTMMENRRVPEYQMEDSVQALIDLCGCKFQIGHYLSEQISSREACRIARIVIFHSSVDSNFSLEISCQFCQLILSILAPDLESCNSESIQTHLLFILEILTDKCKQDGAEFILYEANKLKSKILSALCFFNLTNKKTESALDYFTELQSMNQKLNENGQLSSQNSILEQILNFKIQLQSGKLQLAEEEFSRILDRKDSKKELILYLIEECMKWSPSTPETLINLLNKRTPPDPEILIKTASCLLTKEQDSESTDQVILKLLNSASNRDSLIQRQDLGDSCYALLWNRGVQLFDRKDFQRGTAFFEAAYSYSTTSTRSKTARAVALCLLGAKNFSRSLEWISLCLSVAGQHLQVADCFVRFKLALLRVDREDCEECIDLMIQCHDFTPQIIKVACQEAMSSGMHGLAKKTLKRLHNMYLEDGPSFQGLTESVILRCLIKCSLELFHADPNQDCGEVLNELCSEFDLVVKRLDVVGFNTFFGVFSDSTDVSVLTELEWFVFQSWNLATHRAEKEDHERGTVLFAASAMLMSHYPCPLHKHKSHTKTGYLLAASSALQIHDLSIDDNEAKSKSSLQTAKELFKRGKSIKGTDLADSNFIELFLDFEILRRNGQTESLKKLIESSRKSRNIKGDHLIKLATALKNSENPDHDLGLLIFKIALQKLLAESPPCFDRVFMVQRMLIQQTHDLEWKLTLFQEALQMIQFHRRWLCDFPVKEVHWLVASCWNQGLHNMRFNRKEIALNFMTAAIALVEFCPEMKSKTDSMMHEIERIKQSY